MSKIDKLIDRFFEIPIKADITVKELDKIMAYYGFLKIEGEGSRVKYFHSSKNLLACIHTPHPQKEIDKGAIRDLQKLLKECR